MIERDKDFVLERRQPPEIECLCNMSVRKEIAVRLDNLAVGEDVNLDLIDVDSDLVASDEGESEPFAGNDLQEHVLAPVGELIKEDIEFIFGDVSL